MAAATILKNRKIYRSKDNDVIKTAYTA